MDVTSKGLGSIVGGMIFIPSHEDSIVLIAVTATAVLVGTSILVSSLFRFIARQAYKG